MSSDFCFNPLFLLPSKDSKLRTTLRCLVSLNKIKGVKFCDSTKYTPPHSLTVVLLHGSTLGCPSPSLKTTSLWVATVSFHHSIDWIESSLGLVDCYRRNSRSTFVSLLHFVVRTSLKVVADKRCTNSINQRIGFRKKKLHTHWLWVQLKLESEEMTEQVSREPHY